VNETPSSRDLAARSDGCRVLVCMVKAGPIAAQRCVEQQAEGCYCPQGARALKGVEQAAAENLTQSQRAQLVELKARADGLTRQSAERQFAGLALRVENERRAKGHPATTLPEPVKLAPVVVPPKVRPPAPAPAVQTSGLSLAPVQPTAPAAPAAAAPAVPAPPVIKRFCLCGCGREIAFFNRSGISGYCNRGSKVASKGEGGRAPCPKCQRPANPSGWVPHAKFNDGKTPVCGRCVYSLNHIGVPKPGPIAAAPAPAAAPSPAPFAEHLDTLLVTSEEMRVLRATNEALASAGLRAKSEIDKLLAENAALRLQVGASPSEAGQDDEIDTIRALLKSIAKLTSAGRLYLAGRIGEERRVA
jgi:hypothetical protein